MKKIIAGIFFYEVSLYFLNKSAAVDQKASGQSLPQGFQSLGRKTDPNKKVKEVNMTGECCTLFKIFAKKPKQNSAVTQQQQKRSTWLNPLNRKNVHSRKMQVMS